MRCKKCRNSGATMLISMVISPQNIAKNMVLTYLHFRILDPLEISRWSWTCLSINSSWGEFMDPIIILSILDDTHINAIYPISAILWSIISWNYHWSWTFLYKCHQFMPSIHVIHGDLSLPFLSIWRKKSQVCRSPWAATDRSQAPWSRRAPGKGNGTTVPSIGGFKNWSTNK